MDYFTFTGTMPGIKSKQNEFLLLTSSLLPSLALFRKNDPLRMAGATAFFTTFALPPIVFILIFGLFIGRRKMGRELIEKISDTVGKDGAEQVRLVLRSIRGFSDSWYVIVIGLIFLFLL
jgi:membrane protein